MPPDSSKALPVRRANAFAFIFDRAEGDGAVGVVGAFAQARSKEGGGEDDAEGGDGDPPGDGDSDLGEEEPAGGRDGDADDEGDEKAAVDGWGCLRHAGECYEAVVDTMTD